MVLDGVQRYSNAERQQFKSYHIKLSPEAQDRLLKLRRHYGGIDGAALIEALVHRAANELS